MPVNYVPPTAEALLPVPGVTLGATAARIKNWARDDCLLVLCEPGTVAAGVFTQNRFCAAPVIVCRDHLARQHATRSNFRALVVNAGHATLASVTAQHRPPKEPLFDAGLDDRGTGFPCVVRVSLLLLEFRRRCPFPLLPELRKCL